MKELLVNEKIFSLLIKTINKKHFNLLFYKNLKKWVIIIVISIIKKVNAGLNLMIYQYLLKVKKLYFKKLMVKILQVLILWFI